MSWDLNKVFLIGRLSNDPELKYTPTGTAVCNFSIAVNGKPDKDGKSDASFFNVVVWGKTAESVKNYTAKGKLIGIDGHLQQRSWTAQDGTKRYAVEAVADRVQFLTPRDNTQQAQPADDSRYYDNSEPTFAGPEWDNNESVLF